MQRWESQFQQIHVQNAPIPKAQGTLQKRGQKDCQSQRTRESAVWLCLLAMSEHIPIKSHQYNFLSMKQGSLNRNDTNRYPNTEGEKLMKPQHNYRQRNGESWKNRENHINWLNIIRLKTQGTLSWLYRLYLGLNMYMRYVFPAGVFNGGLKTLFRLTLLTLIKTSKESDTRWFIPNKSK